MNIKYMVRVIVNGEFKGYLTYRDKTVWSKRTAKKHAKDCMKLFGKECIIEEVYL